MAAIASCELPGPRASGWRIPPGTRKSVQGAEGKQGGYGTGQGRNGQRWHEEEDGSGSQIFPLPQGGLQGHVGAAATLRRELSWIVLR